MAERKWTPAQWDAIKYSGKNLLVSAAAGSGKTATLTRRIIRLIADEGADISRMLIVTFTKAAAAELRERITAALTDELGRCPGNRHLAEQVCRVRGAMIHTMDAFFLSFVKPMFSEVGLPADFRIADEGELAALMESAMEEATGEFYESDEGDGEFSLLAEAFGSARAEDALEGVFIEFIKELDSKNIGSEELFSYAARLAELADTDPALSPLYDPVFDLAVSAMEYYRSTTAKILPKLREYEELNPSYIESAERLFEYSSHCLEAADDRQRLRALLLSPPELVLRSTKANKGHNDPPATAFKTLKKDYEATVEKLKDSFFSYTPEEARAVILHTAKITHGAALLVERFTDIFSTAKKRRGVASFSDVARMAADLLCDKDGNLTPYGESVAAMYDFVFIDEYQDTSPLQDRIFSAVSHRCGRFMVGDIKQSIYAFRGGDPRAFARYRSMWDMGEGGSVIHMSDNFRCSEEVVRFANAVSAYMFPYGDIGFDESEDLLVHGRHEPDTSDTTPVEICLIEKPRGGGGREIDEDDAPAADPVSAKDVEAEYLARRIRRMIDFEHLPDGRRITPGDIAIMARSWGRASAVESALERYGIPVCKSRSESLLDRPEVLLLLCILRAADNPTNDVALAGMMRSAAFGFTLGDVAEIKLAFKKDVGHGYLIDAVRYMAEKEGALALKCRKFCDILARYRTVSSTVNAADFIYSLIRDPAVMCAMEEEGGVMEEHFAKRFYELARARGTSLFDFLSYIDKAAKEGIGTESVDTGEGVTFLTVHKSKGLEFPVCFLINAGTRYQTTAESKKSLIIDEDFGPVMRLPDPSGLVKCDNFLRRVALLKKESAEVLEEMRILYVAMTRARDRLVITSTVNDAAKYLEEAKKAAPYSCSYSVRLVRNHLSLILRAVINDGGSAADIQTVHLSEILDGTPNAAKEVSPVPVTEITREVSDLVGTVSERLAYTYPHTHLKNIPSKLTVSRLYPEILDDIDGGAVLPGIDEVTEPSVPRFMRGTAYSPADAGSAAHLILQFCDFERLYSLGVGAELCRLRDEGFISSAEAEAAELSYIETFRSSNFFRDIRTARWVRREFRFNAAIPAAALTSEGERRILFEKDGTDVIVQGVIDIVYETGDGRLILADYKTDRLTDFELSHKGAAAKKLWGRHKNQLSYYALVCSALFGRTPDEVLIYSMPLGDTVSPEESL